MAQTLKSTIILLSAPPLCVQRVTARYTPPLSRWGLAQDSSYHTNKKKRHACHRNFTEEVGTVHYQGVSN